MTGELGFLIEIIKAVGFPAVIFVIWYLYHKSQIEVLKQLLQEQAKREERNFQNLQAIVEALQANISTLCRIEYKIDTGYNCPLMKKEIV